jgi:predicted O-methyltransferase YrrM
MMHAGRWFVEDTVRSEAEWTAPTDDCPNPELWHAPDRAATEIEVSELVGAMCTALKPTHALETGAYRGHTSEAMGRALVGIGHLDSLEVDSALAREARARVEGLPVTLHEVSSLDFVPEHPLDFVFFDSEFDLRPVEIERFRRFATKRCVWALHDSRHDGLQAALEELRERGVVSEVLQLPTPRGLALGRYVDPGA